MTDIGNLIKQEHHEYQYLWNKNHAHRTLKPQKTVTKIPQQHRYNPLKGHLYYVKHRQQCLHSSKSWNHRNQNRKHNYDRTYYLAHKASIKRRQHRNYLKRKQRKQLANRD